MRQVQRGSNYCGENKRSGGVIVEIKKLYQEFSVCQVEDYSLVNLKSEQGISIFAVSTYNTDYVFIKEENYQRGLEILETSGYDISD